jgi:hypothetical protein
MGTSGVIHFEQARDRRLLWLDLKVDSLAMAFGTLIAIGLGVTGYWVVPFFTGVGLLMIYGLGGALYGAVTDYFLKDRCEGGNEYPADPVYRILTVLLGLGVLFLIRFLAGWVIGSSAVSTSAGASDLIYSVLSLFFIGAPAGGAASHLAFERRYSVGRWYRTGRELGTGRRRTVFYTRPLSGLDSTASPDIDRSE